MFVRDGLTTKLSYGQAAQVGRELQCLLCGITVCPAVNVCKPPEATVRIVAFRLEPASTQEHRQIRRSDRSPSSCWITHFYIEPDAS